MYIALTRRPLCVDRSFTNVHNRIVCFENTMPLCGRALAAALGLGDEILQEHHLSFYVLGVENLAWVFEYQFSFVKMRRRDVQIRKVAGAAGVSALGLLFLAL